MGVFCLQVVTYIIDMLKKLAAGLSCLCSIRKKMSLFLVFFTFCCLISLHASQQIGQTSVPNDRRKQQFHLI